MTLKQVAGTDKHPEQFVVLDKNGRRIAHICGKDNADSVMAGIGEYETWSDIPANVRMKLAIAGIGV